MREEQRICVKGVRRNNVRSEKVKVKKREVKKDELTPEHELL